MATVREAIAAVVAAGDELVKVDARVAESAKAADEALAAAKAVEAEKVKAVAALRTANANLSKTLG